MGNAAAGEAENPGARRAGEAEEPKARRRPCGASTRVSSPGGEAPEVRIPCLGRAAPEAGALLLPIPQRRRKRGVGLEAPQEAQAGEAVAKAPEAAAAAASAPSGARRGVCFAESPSVMPITPYSQLSWASTPANDNEEDTPGDPGDEPTPLYGGDILGIDESAHEAGGRTSRAQDSPAAQLAFGS